ncbi:hypothetical protein V8E36_009093 [Tilletia maclaganii]
MPPKASSSKKDAASGIDDELDAFVDEILNDLVQAEINFPKQRAETAKFAKHFKERVDGAEREAMAQVTAVGKDLNQMLPATDKGKDGSDKKDKNLEQSIASVNAALEDVLGTMQYEGDVDKTSVGGGEEMPPGFQTSPWSRSLKLLRLFVRR